MTDRIRMLNDERGAIAAIVVISLIGLLGMLVLTVDLGGMLTMRRRMVEASDAAALAGAQSCAKQFPDEARSQADAFATDNESGATNVAYTATGCTDMAPSGTVQVAYKAPVNLQFAPVLGLPNQTTVQAAATAEWGPAGDIGALPIVISIDGLGRIPCVWEPKGTACNYWYDNSASGFTNSADWGFLNLAGWGVQGGASCPSAGTSTRRDWIDSIDTPDLPINATGPTYVCADTGHSTSSWYNALAGLVGEIRYFPVNDPTKMILRPPGSEKYDIIGFTALKISAVLQGNDPVAVGSPGTTSTCTTTVSLVPGGTINLDGITAKNCPRGTHPDSLANLVLSSGTGSKKVTYQEGVDYSFDGSTDVVTWNAKANSNVDISFDWTTGTTYGSCGFHKSDPNGVCLVATWQGAQIGGTRPGGGKDFGIRAIRLSD